jgi:nucleotide-binding universal stress UspA family protein
LVPLDGSPLAELALPHAAAVAKQGQSIPTDIVLLRVRVPLFGLATRATSDWLKEQERAGRQKAKEYLNGVENQLKDTGLNVRSEVLLGSAEDRIVDYAAESPFNVIVMTTHGRSGLSRWAYGSVAQKVLRGASSPVVLIRQGN